MANKKKQHKWATKSTCSCVRTWYASNSWRKSSPHLTITDSSFQLARCPYGDDSRIRRTFSRHGSFIAAADGSSGSLCTFITIALQQTNKNHNTMKARDDIHDKIIVGVHPVHLMNVEELPTLRSSQPQRQHCPKIMNPPQSLPLQMTEHLLRAQPDSVANHITDRSISDRRALTWLATKTSWAQSKRSAISSGKLISGYMIWYDVNRLYGIQNIYVWVVKPNDLHTISVGCYHLHPPWLLIVLLSLTAVTWLLHAHGWIWSYDVTHCNQMHLTHWHQQFDTRKNI